MIGGPDYRGMGDVKEAIAREYGERIVLMFRKEFDDRLQEAVKLEVNRQLSGALRDLSRLALNQEVKP